MPDLDYVFVPSSSGACSSLHGPRQRGVLTGPPSPVGPGAFLNTAPTTVAVTVAQLLNAQLRLGVFAGPLAWDAEECRWRIHSLCLSCVPFTGPVPPPPGRSFVPRGPLPIGGAGPALTCSHVAAQVDMTEKGQLGYHIGTAVGGALAEHLYTRGPPGTRWFAFHLTRARASGGVFQTLGRRSPDIVMFAVDAGSQTLYEWVVWENKGHCVRVGRAPVSSALAQAQSMQSVSRLPGAPGLQANLGSARPPDAHIASSVDTFYGRFRVHTADPPGNPPEPHALTSEACGAFLWAYYKPFVDIIGVQHDGLQHGGRRFSIHPLPRNVALGLEAEILAAHREHGPTARFADAVAHATAAPFECTATVHVHETGILLSCPDDMAALGPEGP